MSNEYHLFGSPDTTPSQLQIISNVEEEAIENIYYPFNSPPATSSQLEAISRIEDEAFAGPSTTSDPLVIPETPPHQCSFEKVRLIIVRNISTLIENWIWV